MNRLERLTALLLQLQAHRVVRAAALAAAYHVSRRTIYRDLRTLEAAGVPLTSEDGGGFSLAEGYRLPPVMLTREEALALLTAEKLAEGFTDPATARLTRAAMDKLRAVLRRADRDYLAIVAPHLAIQSRHALPDGAPAAPTDARQVLLAGLASHRVVHVTYRAGYGQQLTERAIEPIGLYFNLHWHVVAYCRLRQAVRDFRLDRIEQLILQPETFAPRSETLASYWAQQRAQSPLLEVVLHFSARGRHLVRDEKYFYGWVAERELPAGAVEIELLTPTLRYLAHWLLYFGAEATVVTPLSLHQLIIDLAQQALAHHTVAHETTLPAPAVTGRPAPTR